MSTPILQAQLDSYLSKYQALLTTRNQAQESWAGLMEMDSLLSYVLKKSVTLQLVTIEGRLLNLGTKIARLQYHLSKGESWSVSSTVSPAHSRGEQPSENSPQETPAHWASAYGIASTCACSGGS